MSKERNVDDADLANMSGGISSQPEPEKELSGAIGSGSGHPGKPGGTSRLDGDPVDGGGSGSSVEVENQGQTGEESTFTNR